MSFDDQPQTTFSDFAFSPAILKAIDDLGYESPTPIQTTIIPHVLAGADVVGQAQTGTGKTAAFALPLLSRLDLKKESRRSWYWPLPGSWPSRLPRHFIVTPPI